VKTSFTPERKTEIPQEHKHSQKQQKGGHKLLRIIAISLPNYNRPHIIRTYLCSVLTIEMLQSCRLST